MQPNPPAPSDPNNPYEFIMKAPAGKSGGLKGALAGGSRATRLAVVAIGFGVLLIIGIGAFAFLNSGKSANADALTSLAVQQNKLIQLADIGKEKADGNDVKNLATTAKLSLSSNQTDTLAILAKSGNELDKEELGALSDDVADELDSAKESGNFDQKFISVVKEELTKYRVSIQSGYKTASTNNERQLLQSCFNTVTELLGSQSASAGS